MTPPLARICVACRTAYAEGGVCEGGDGHDVVALDEVAQRRRMIEAVWGDVDTRDKIRAGVSATYRRMQGLVLGGGASGFLGGMWLGPVGAATLCAIGGTFVGGLIAHATRPRLPSSYPIGAAPPPWGKVSGRGRVRAAVGADSPASGESCAAWQLMLRYDGMWGERVMLRAGASAGLEIALDGGEVLRIGAGPIALAEAPQQVDDLSAARVQALVVGLDPLGRAGEPFTPLPYNVVVETLLFVGDRVEVLSGMERVVVSTLPPAAGGGGLYRASPPSRLVSHGLAILRRY